MAVSDDVLHPAVGSVENLRDLGAGVTLVKEAENVLLVFKRKR